MINGRARSGKDYTADLLQDELVKFGYTVDRVSFAEPMKQIIATTFGIHLDELDYYKNERLPVLVQEEDGDEKYLTNFREVLQRFGTEAMKPVFGDDVWAKIGTSKALHSETTFTIISDYRFDTEYDTVRDAILQDTREYGTSTYLVTIHIDSLQDKLISGHPSEQKPQAPFDYHVDNTLQDSTVKYWVQEFVERRGWKYAL